MALAPKPGAKDRLSAGLNKVIRVPAYPQPQILHALWATGKGILLGFRFHRCLLTDRSRTGEPETLGVHHVRLPLRMGTDAIRSRIRTGNRAAGEAKLLGGMKWL